jgi:hypothetical protein
VSQMENFSHSVFTACSGDIQICNASEIIVAERTIRVNVIAP